MPRRILIRQNEFPYHVTSRTNNKDWFQIPIFMVWDIVKESLIYAQSKVQINLHCFVLMGNHYHMLLTTPNSDIDRFMMHFNRKLSICINKEAQRINHKFSNRYAWTIVDNQAYLLSVYRYIYQNPVRAGITDSCFSWPYSSLHFSSFESKKMRHSPHINYGKEKYWFERRVGEDLDLIIRKSLKKQVFKISKASKHLQNIFNQPLKY